MEINFGGKIFEPSTRTVNDMLEVQISRIKLGKSESILYYMFRDLSKNDDDHKKILEAELRYDITIIPPATVGEEFVKTFGHYHPKILGTDLSYPEIYQVLEGTAHYILQKKQKGKISDVAVIKATAGDYIIIPPDYGHVTVNPSNKQLKMANWVSRHFASLYKDYQEKHGATYYELSDGTFIENDSYINLPPLRFCKPFNSTPLELAQGQEMYDLVEKLDILEFLIKPQDHMSLFNKLLK